MKTQEEKKSLTLINSSIVKSILEKLGYRLIDCGNHWRTSAMYRGGDNPTAIQIYKNTGVWIDYTHGDNTSKPFDSLLKLTLKDDIGQLKETLKSLDSKEDIQYQPKELIEMDKIYPKSYLEKLFPNYKFYLDRKISEDTQKFFKIGLAGAGQMYRRMVFPIYDENAQIVGFSGRRVDDGDFAKWKHLGRKRKWIYPAHIPAKETVDSIIDNQKSVFLVESIGDSMALYDQGIKNTLVTFGTTISNDLINYLCSKELDKIYISTNNDLNSSRNNGLIGAIQMYIKLSGFFNLDQLEIKLPPKPHNDFGKAHESGYNLASWQLKQMDTQQQRDYINSYIKENKALFTAKYVDKFIKLHE
jgi:hypothetical protein